MHRFAHAPDQAQHARTDDQSAEHDQHRPQHEKREIELAHEQAVDANDVQTLLRDRAGERAEDRQRREQHDVAGHLQHDVRRRHRARRRRDAAALAERRHRGAEEQREHDDLQDLVARHRIDDAGRNRVRDEACQRQRVALHAGCGAASGIGSCMALPGSNSCTSIRPSVSETSEAKMNQPSDLPPTRPTVAMSPILAMPTTSVENTSGAMIILIRRRNAIGSSDSRLGEAAARGREVACWRCSRR